MECRLNSDSDIEHLCGEVQHARTCQCHGFLSIIVGCRRCVPASQSVDAPSIAFGRKGRGINERKVGGKGMSGYDLADIDHDECSEEQ